jgi:hypothetical protein
MEKDTPEYFYKRIQEVQTKLNADETDDNYKTYYDELTRLRHEIQSQIDLIITEKPVKSQQMLKDYKEIYDTTYMTNFSLFLGICLVFYYIFKSNNNTTTPANVATNP